MPEITLEKLMSRFGAEMEGRRSEFFISRRREIMPTNSCPNLLQEYALGQKIGQGTYGHVVKGWKKGPNGEKVGPTLAIKELDLKFYNSEDGYPSIFTREIRILQRLPNCRFVVKLLDIASSDAPLIFNDSTEKKRMQTFLVFEYVSHDLAGLLSHHKFEVEEVRVIFSQLLQGLCFIHAHRIVHRDLKLSNILISNEGVVKIADFGLSRLLREKEGEESYMTARIVTLWYRSVELLLGSHTYGTAVDMWSSGCILGEMLSQRPLFSSDNEQKVFQRVCQLLGSPNAETLPQRHDYPKWQEMREIAYTTSERLGGNSQIREKFEKYGEESLALLENLLIFDPRKRATAEECARSPWFDKPTTPKAFQFLAIPPKRELDARKSRANKSSQEATSGTRKPLGSDDHPNSRSADENLVSEDVDETPSNWPFPKTVGVPNQVCHTLAEYMEWKPTYAEAEKLRLKQRKKDVRRLNRDKRAKLRELKAIRLSKMETKVPRKPNNGRLRTTMNTRPHPDQRDHGWRGHRESHPVRGVHRDQDGPPPPLLENPREVAWQNRRGYSSSNFYGTPQVSHYYGRHPLPECRDRDPPRNTPRDRGWKPSLRSNSRSDSRHQSSRSRSRRKRPVRRSVYGMPRRR